MASIKLVTDGVVEVAGHMASVTVKNQRDLVAAVVEAIDDFDMAVEAPLDRRTRSGSTPRAMIAAAAAAELRGEPTPFRVVTASPDAKAEEAKMAAMIVAAANALQRKLEQAGAKLA